MKTTEKIKEFIRELISAAETIETILALEAILIFIKGEDEPEA